MITSSPKQRETRTCVFLSSGVTHLLVIRPLLRYLVANDGLQEVILCPQALALLFIGLGEVGGLWRVTRTRGQQGCEHLVKETVSTLREMREYPTQEVRL